MEFAITHADTNETYKTTSLNAMLRELGLGKMNRERGLKKLAELGYNVASIVETKSTTTSRTVSLGKKLHALALETVASEKQALEAERARLVTQITVDSDITKIVEINEKIANVDKNALTVKNLGTIALALVDEYLESETETKVTEPKK